MNIFIKLVFLVFILFSDLVQAANIIQITVDERGIPFLLDDAGHVWGFQNIHNTFEDPVKLPELEHIKKIAPYIALNDKGQVFTWGLDVAKVETVEDEIWEIGYTTPKKVESLDDVSLIAHSLNHFFAVKGNREIVEWREFRDEYGLGVLRYGPISTVFSGNGIKAIVSAPGKLDDRDSKLSSYGLAALLEDGTVMGWGITATGQVTKETDTPRILLTKSPSAIGLAMNAFHTVILTAQGVPQFLGGCDLYGRDVADYRQPWSHGNVKGVDGYVNNVIGMAITQEPLGSITSGNDNFSYDMFIKRDGTVWISFAPIPTEASGLDCGQNNRKINYRQARQLVVEKAAAMQVATGGGKFFMLDENHKLWVIQDTYWQSEFHAISINLK